MRKILTLIVLFPVLIDISEGRTDMSAEMAACKNVELMIGNEFPAGTGLPKTWDEIPGIREIKSNPSITSLARLKQINRLALVPAAPLILHKTGISNERANRRLFAISRNWTGKGLQGDSEDSIPNEGRYVITVDAKTNTPLGQWIPKAEARLILEQLHNFDPTAQPLAFENVVQFEREAKARHQRLMDGVKKHVARTSRWKMMGISVGALVAWIAGGLVALGAAIWLVAKMFRRKVGSGG